MKLRLKRDETGDGFPSAEQVSVGELVINSKTGKLYSKLMDGSIVEWIGQKICFDPLPIIVFNYNNTNTTNIDNFCCSGDILIVSVDKLKPDPASYSFSITELTNNSLPELIQQSAPRYEVYEETIDDVVTTYRKALIPFNISVNPDRYNNITILKFSVYNENNKLLTEQIIPFKCIESTL